MPDNVIYDYISAHKLSSNHRASLSGNNLCGCFYCCEIFNSNEIQDWCDDDTTAICPYCLIDSIIAEQDGIILTKEFLSQMNKYWF